MEESGPVASSCERGCGAAEQWQHTGQVVIALVTLQLALPAAAAWLEATSPAQNCRTPWVDTKRAEHRCEPSCSLVDAILGSTLMNVVWVVSPHKSMGSYVLHLALALGVSRRDVVLAARNREDC
jgi:hypothetical protein